MQKAECKRQKCSKGLLHLCIVHFAFCIQAALNFFDHRVGVHVDDCYRAVEQVGHVGYLDGLRGFRIPAIVVSPFARRGAVASTTFDHASVLRFIEWRWKLEPLAERDAAANNLAEILDFSSRNWAAPAYLFDPGPYAAFCPPTGVDKWERIRELAAFFGFFA